MKSLGELKAELSDVERQLDTITVRKYNPPHYDYERGEVVGEGSSYNEYRDESLARQLLSKIDYLRDHINNYGYYAQMERDNIDFQHQMQEKAENQAITLNAKGLYEKALNDYHQKSFIGKIGAIFSGKRPKKNLSDKEVQEAYGMEARIQFEVDSIKARIEQLENEKALQIEWTRNNPTEHQQEFLNYYEYYYNEQIEKLRTRLAELNGQRKVR